MVYGIGTDICSVLRIQGVYDRLGERCVRRFLGPQEQAMFWSYYRVSTSRAMVYLASRFSVKEAFSKAWGTGIGKDFGFQDIQVLNHHSGQPYCVFSDLFKQRLKPYQVFVSISTEQAYVSTFVVIERSE